MRCPDCGRSSRSPHGRACATRRQRGKEACSYSRIPNARKIEVEVWEAVKAVLLGPGAWSAAPTPTSRPRRKKRGDPEKEARVFANTIAEVDRKRAAYQDLVAEDGLDMVEERRRKVRELRLSREKKILARYRDAVPEALEEADGKQRRTVYNTLGVTVWAARTKEDPIKIVFGALGGEEVCHSDATSTR